MKMLKQLSASIILVIALLGCVHAGDMNCPPDPPPPPAARISSTESDSQQTQKLTAPEEGTVVSIVVFDVLWNLLSMY